MANGLEDLLDRLRDELEDRGLSEDRIDDLLEGFRDILDTDESDRDLEDLARLGGRLVRAGASGAAGGDAELIRQLVLALTPVAQGFLNKLIDQLLRPTGGYRVRLAPDDPNSVEKINEEGSEEDSAARCALISGSERIECVDENNVRITFSVRVMIEEEPVRRITATILDLEGTRIGGDRPLMAGKDPGVPEIGGDGNDERDDRFDLDIVLALTCDQVYRNGGVVILRIVAEDEDRNYFIYHSLVSLTALLLDTNFECCARYRAEDLIAEFIHRISDAIKVPDRERFRTMLDEFLKARDQSTVTPPADTKSLSDTSFSLQRIDMRLPDDSERVVIATEDREDLGPSRRG